MKVFISSDNKFKNAILNNLGNVVRNNKTSISMENLQKAILSVAEKINARISFEDVNEKITVARTQSVGWHYFNEIVAKDTSMDGELIEAFNKIFLELGITFERVGSYARSLQGDLSELNVAKDLNETFRCMRIPIMFHNDCFGQVRNTADLKKKTGKSFIRRPIAKTELVLSWIAYVLDKMKKNKELDEEEAFFVKMVTIMLTAFLSRFTRKQICYDQLAFIRLMEVVYIYFAPADMQTENYKGWYSHMNIFCYLKDFNDIRISNDENSIESHLSLRPRAPSTIYAKDVMFYNPTDCLPGSPIHWATSLWIDAKKNIAADNSFINIMKQTIAASFSYESEFTGSPEEARNCNDLNAEWYKHVKTYDINDESTASEIRILQQSIMERVNSEVSSEFKEYALELSLLVKVDDEICVAHVFP